MEGGRNTEQDVDELDMLLGEIPKSLGNPHDVPYIPVDISSGLKTISVEGNNEILSHSSKSTNLYNSPRSVKNGGNLTLFGGLPLAEISVDRKHQTNGKLDYANNDYEAYALNGDYEAYALNGNGDDVDLPDDKSLASAFDELSFKDMVASKPNIPSFARYKQTSPNDSSFNNSRSFFGMDSLEMPIPPLHQTMNEVSIDTRVNVNFLGYNGAELKMPEPEIFSNDLVNQSRSFHVYNGAMPLNPRGNAYQLIPNVPVPGIELPNSPYQQFMDAHALNFMPHQHLGQSKTTWHNLDGERFHRIQHQYLHQQPLEYHRSKVIQFQKEMNLATQVQPYYEMSSDQNSYWNDNVVPSGYSQFDSSAIGSGIHQYHPQNLFGRVDGSEFSHGQQHFNTSNFLEHQVLDNIEKQYCPEIFLTRSHGVNSLRSLRSNSFTTNHSTHFAHNNRRSISDAHGRHLLVRNNGSLKLDSQSSRSSSPDSADSKHDPKSSQAKYNYVDEVIGRIYSLAKDQHGCRFLQRKFTEGGVEDANRIFSEINDHILELMTDPFGNYLIQKMLEVCTEDQKMQIIYAITREAGILIGISCNMHGTRAVQKVIETLKSTEQIYMVVSSLKPGIVSLIKDINGNHVAQRCLQYFQPKQNEFLFDAVISRCVEIAMDRQGCVVLQKCVHHSYGNQRNRLMSEISSYSLILSQNPYGNYVVQYVLDEKVPWVITAVLEQLEGNYGCLSMQKHSSNVVEKCLELANEEDRAKIIRELTNSPQFLQILQDAYGNFVIQSALRECKGALNAALVDAIKPHVPALRSHPFGKKVLSSSSLKK